MGAPFSIFCIINSQKILLALDLTWLWWRRQDGTRAQHTWKWRLIWYMWVNGRISFWDNPFRFPTWWGRTKYAHRPNWSIKQRSVHTRHKKYHGLSVLTVSCQSGMGTVVDVVSSRDWDRTILTWSNFDNVLHYLCVNNNKNDTFCFCTDDRFLGGRICIRIPHRGTWQFPLNNRLLMKNVAMKKIRTRTEWACCIVDLY